MSEKLIEKKLRLGMKKRKGIALKFVSPSFSGVPDRIVLAPVERIWFVETKSEGKDLGPLQKVVRKLLEGLGFKYRKIDDEVSLAEFFKEVDSEI